MIKSNPEYTTKAVPGLTPGGPMPRPHADRLPREPPDDATARSAPAPEAVVYVHGVGPGDQYKVREHAQVTDPPFHDIRIMCERDCVDPNIDTSPDAFIDHRCREWPNMREDALPLAGGADCRKIYQAVKATGLPNCMGARIPLVSGLKIEAWESYVDRASDEVQLLEFIKFGFPLGYLGPTSDTTTAPNHSSARDYHAQVQAFVDAELEKGALVGPFLAPPFYPWLHVSPLMSRPKSDGINRRVISDLTFPKESSVNAYIQKNGTLGEVRDHTLPTVADFVGDLKEVGVGAVMFTVDVARAYKNFRVDALDWPLMCIKWDDRYYVETAMPFGARSSSCYMQRVANMIVRILGKKGIRARMYLDDLIVVAPTEEVAQAQYKRVQTLLDDLGLPEAPDKAQPPATNDKWLGINICSKSMCLSIPEDKLQAILAEIERCRHKKTIHRRMYESLLGRLLHVAKCVVPARAFLSRMLQAYRDAKGWFVKVTPEVKADIDWFLEFCAQWNGRAIIPPDEPDTCLQVDACLSGIGASDGKQAYSGVISGQNDGTFNITELEAINVIVALHTFLTEAHRGRHILVQCDNLAAVQAFKWGRARNAVLAECARGAWMVQAVLDVSLTFAHIAGLDNGVADRLSRAHLTPTDLHKAEEAVQERKLIIIDPCLHIFSILSPHAPNRRGVQLAGDGGRGTAGGVQGAGHQGEPRRGDQTTGGVREAIRHRCGKDVARGRLPLIEYLVVAGAMPGTVKNQLSHARVHARLAGGTTASEGSDGGGRTDEAKGLQIRGKGRDPGRDIHGGARLPSQDSRSPGAQSCVYHNVPGHHETIRGGATILQKVRPPSSYNKGRRVSIGQGGDQAEMGQKPAKVQPSTSYYIAAYRKSPHMSSEGSESGYGHTPGLSPRLAPPTVSKIRTGGLDRFSQSGVVSSGITSGGGSKTVQHAQHKKGIGDERLCSGLQRARGPEARRLDLSGTQDIHRHIGLNVSSPHYQRH